MPEVLDAWQGVSEGWEQGVQDSYRGPERGVADLGAEVQFGVNRGGVRYGTQQRSGPGTRAGEGPSPSQPNRRFDESVGDWVQGPTVDDMDTEVPANVKLNRGGVFYWHPYM